MIKINIYYVYIWFIKETGEVFYVGKGHGDRYKTMKKRSSEFMFYKNNYNCDVEIVEANLSEKEAFSTEYDLIKLLKEKGQAKANIKDGGEFGGNSFKYASEERKEEFKIKMTAINKKRCNTKEFKEKTRTRMIQRYSNPIERKKQSIKSHKYWDNEDVKKEHSKKIKEIYKNNPQIIIERAKKMCKPCVLELDDQKIEFSSRKELEKYLKDILRATFNRPELTKLLKEKIIYQSPNKKRVHLNGLKVYYKDVETIENETTS